MRDSGLLHALLALEDPAALERHPKCGASWEGFILEQLLAVLDLPEERVYFWRAHTGAELDLLVDRGAGVGGPVAQARHLGCRCCDASRVLSALA